MDKKTRERLEAAGFRVGTAAEFLGLTDEDRKVIELRLLVGRAVAARRTAAEQTQGHLAAAVGSSQSRVAKVEGGSGGVSLDLAFKMLFAVGGGLDDLTGSPGTPPPPRGRTPKPEARGKKPAHRTRGPRSAAM